MKQLLLTVTALALSFTSFAQWVTQAGNFGVNNSEVADIEAVNANVVWALSRGPNGSGIHSHEFTRTTTGGTGGWIGGTVAAAPALYDFSNISPLDATTAWVAMYNSAGSGGGIFKTTNGGITWAQQGAGQIFTSATSFPNFVHFFDANTGIAVGDPANGYFEIYRTSNGGTTWTRVPQANIPANGATEYGTIDRYCVQGATIWFTTTFGKVYKSINGGLNWTATTPLLVAGTGIAFTDFSNGIVVSANNEIFKTTNGGSTWSAVTISGPFHPFDVQAVPGTTAIVSTDGTGTSYSYDYGANWTAIDVGMAHFVSTWANATTGYSGGFTTAPSVNGLFKYNGPPIAPVLGGMTSTTIGSTWYQLQTNASINNTLVRNSDGTMSATWTMSNLNDGAWGDRGTGYNYFTGNVWYAAPSGRIEQERTGWGNIAVTGSGAEFSVSHTGYGLHRERRPVKGIGNWTADTLNTIDTWPRTVMGGADGNTIHMIAQSSGVSGNPVNGQTGPISYNRSQNAGATWDITNYYNPLIDASVSIGYGGDNYAIDAKGNTVAIVVGGLGKDLILLKSTNNGSTWTRTYIQTFPIPLYDPATMNTDVNADGIADTLTSNSGSMEVLIDNAGMVHVWAGKARALEEIGATGLFYFPVDDGLIYWKESMGANNSTTIGTFVDIDGNGIQFSTVARANYGVAGVCTHPTAGIDASGNLYLAYSAVFDGLSDDGTAEAIAGGKSFRHILITKSSNGGVTWCAPIDIISPDNANPVNGVEAVFPSMARLVDANVHLTCQKDASPGHGVSLPSDPQTGKADIVYYKIPTNVFCGVVGNPAAVLNLSCIVNNVKCFGLSNGAATALPTGGTPPYTYSWNTTPVQTTPIATGLAGGTYIVNVTDAVGNIANQIITVTTPAAPLSVTASASNTICGQSVGMVTMPAITGGTSPYTFVLNNGTSSSTQFNNLPAGNYTVMVNDSNGCAASSSVLTIAVAAANYNLNISASPQIGAAPLSLAFNNLTAGLSNYTFNWYPGDGNSFVNNNATNFYTYNYGGLYDVTIVATQNSSGCKDTLTMPGFVMVNGGGCTFTVGVTPSAPVTACAGDVVQLTLNTSASLPYTISWNYNGTLISGASAPDLFATQTGFYSATIVSNGCPKTSAATQLTFSSQPPAPVISTAGAIVACAGGQVALTASSIPNVNYLWSNGQSTQSITTGIPGTYFVTVSNISNGCQTTSGAITVNNSIPSPPICLVSVDTLSTHNIVYWEKPVTEEIDSFRVYREVATNVYSHIASVSYDSLSEYHDYAADPNATSYRYKIAVLDTCGDAGALTDFHNTIHLQVLGLGNMQWTLYDIENAGNPVTFYRVLRDDLGTGNFLPISSTIPGGNTTYTDVNYATYPNAKYVVDVSWSISCDPSRININTTRSNIKRPPTTTQIAQIERDEIKMFPNPTTGQFVIKSNAEIKSVKVFNALGELVYQLQNISKREINIDGNTWNTGIYFVELISDNKVMVKKLSKE
jgi:Secretion system C-terminal sorting domain/SprB repeat